MSTDAANYATELRLRAERKLGELLAQTIHRGRPPRKDNGTDPGTFFGSPTLAELGVSKKASAFAQTIARLPDADFESHIAETKARGQELTASRLHELARHTAKEAARQSARLAESGPLPEDVTLWVGDFTARGQQIPEGSVDLILYPEHHRRTARVLQDVETRALGGRLRAIRQRRDPTELIDLVGHPQEDKV
jgi:hypothetical protein